MKKWNLKLIPNDSKREDGSLVAGYIAAHENLVICWGKSKGAARSRAYRILKKREVSNEHQKGF